MSKIPGIKPGFGKGYLTDGLWWMKFQIDITHPLAWHVVQELGHVVNYISLEERLPTVFYPVSPPPYLPYFRGVVPLETYLRHLGYTYILAESPSAPGLFNVNMFYAEYVRSTTYFDSQQAAYFIDWASTVRYLQSADPSAVRSVGSLALIHIG